MLVTVRQAAAVALQRPFKGSTAALDGLADCSMQVLDAAVPTSVQSTVRVCLILC